MDMIQSKLAQIAMAISALCGFMGSYFMDITANNTEQYLAVICVMLLDGFFGIIAGIKREGFKTYKALRVLKNIFAWELILTVILSIELGFTGTGWLSETILAPFLVFQLISALKNASMAGFIKNELLNEILDRIDKHKGERNEKTTK
jgi:4-hydroxybenzoate polyprenyltransferase